ncbi:hypothetical protein SEA_EVAA_32 [Gordonia phage Evaa]|nr:hypothetical protein SEA_EVAA_32 [Gordonia phage Evaa]
MYDPPAGHDDLGSDAEEVETTSRWQPLIVEDVGTITARKPQPAAAHALAMAANAKVSAETKVDHLTLFVRKHISDDDYEGLLAGMMEGTMPINAVQKVARALSVWGTARPTQPLSRSAG